MKKSKSVIITCMLLLIGGLLGVHSANAQDASSSSTFKPSGKIFVQFFGDYYYKLGGNSSTSFSRAQYAKTPSNFNAFDIRRVYFGYQYNFTSDISAKIELANEGNYLPDGDRAFYLKDAEVKINNIIPYGNLVVGHTGTPTFAMYTEHIWGYRSVEKTLLDMRHFGGSNDLGIQLNGNFDKNGVVGYTLMIGNGTGAKIENNKFKKLYAEVHARLFNKKIFLEGYTDYEGGTNQQDVTTLKGYIGYQVPTFTIGTALVKQYRKNAIAQGINSDPSGFWIFTHGSLVKNKLNGFARFDLYNPDKSSNYNEHFVLFGLDYLATKNVHFMPNIWINSYSAKHSTDPSQKADVVGRVTFYYSF